VNAIVATMRNSAKQKWHYNTAKTFVDARESIICLLICVAFLGHGIDTVIDLVNRVVMEAIQSDRSHVRRSVYSNGVDDDQRYWSNQNIFITWAGQKEGANKFG
jgi:hypothetical protein